jgi:hypothetical protein
MPGVEGWPRAADGLRGSQFSNDFSISFFHQWNEIRSNYFGYLEHR